MSLPKIQNDGSMAIDGVNEVRVQVCTKGADRSERKSIT